MTTIEITEEQMSYLKGLDSKKKQRKFLLDCLVESIIGESAKIKEEKCEVCLIYPKIKDSNKCESCNFAIKHSIENDPYFISLRSKKITDLPSKEEFDDMLVGVRKIVEQDELLRFDVLKNNEKDVEIAFLCEIQDYLNAKNITIEVNEVQDLEKIFLKYHEIANSEKKYTEEDMLKCFEESRLFKHESFAQYLNSLEK